MNKKIVVFVAVVWGLVVSASALSVPALNGRVNDNAKLMSANERQEAEEYLAAVEKQSGVQVAVLTVKSLQGDSLEDYANDVFEKWGLGQKGEDNGVLLLVAYNERGVRLEVGYGLEGTLTDLKSGIIIRNIIIPEFKEGDYGAGILAGVKAVGGVVCGDVETENQLKESSAGNSENLEGGLFAMVFIMVWFFIVFSSILRRYGLWGIFIWNLMGRHGPRPKRKPYVPSPHVTVHTSGFGGSHGGGFGGGFSGGGGHSGGGGASGHW
ncbi:MAG: TPM domain-containing protein [Treponema sp.]|nr:TPM domain-containing protein [Treponema sp.]